MSGRFSGSRGGRVNDGYDRGGRGGRGGRGDFRGGRGGSRVQVYESSSVFSPCIHGYLTNITIEEIQIALFQDPMPKLQKSKISMGKAFHPT